MRVAEYKDTSLKGILFRMLKECVPFLGSRALEILVDNLVWYWLKGAAVPVISATLAGLRGTNIMAIYFTSAAIRGIDKGDPKKKGDLVRKAASITVLLSAIGIPIACTSRYTLPLTGQPIEVVNATQNFLYAYSAGLTQTLMVGVGQHLALGDGHSKIIFYLTAANVLVLIPAVGYPLMLSAVVSPETAFGTAYAVSATAHLGSYLLLFKFHPDFKPYDIFNFKKFKVDKAFRNLAKNGTWMFLYGALELLVSVLLSTLLIGQYGINSLKAWAPAQVLGSFEANATFAISGANCLIGLEEFRENNREGAKKIANVSAAVCVLIPSLMLMLFVCKPNSLLDPFIGDSAEEEVRQLAYWNTLLVLGGQVADGLGNAFMGALRSLPTAETAYPTKANALATVLVNLPGALAASKFALNKGAFWIVPPRIATIVIRAMAITRKWFLERDKPQLENGSLQQPLLSTTENRPSVSSKSNTSSWFPCLRRRKKEQIGAPSVPMSQL
jgi:Na+-driven multidrug efflux pump